MNTFKFIRVDDTGPESGACCPHCGAEGRYIYVWEENGVTRAAMAGCYKALTGQLEKGDDVRFYELLAVKQAKGKPLNGWEKTVLRLTDYAVKNPDKADWANRKIYETLSQRKSYLAHKY